MEVKNFAIRFYKFRSGRPIVYKLVLAKMYVINIKMLPKIETQTLNYKYIESLGLILKNFLVIY